MRQVGLEAARHKGCTSIRSQSDRHRCALSRETGVCPFDASPQSGWSRRITHREQRLSLRTDGMPRLVHSCAFLRPRDRTRRRRTPGRAGSGPAAFRHGGRAAPRTGGPGQTGERARDTAHTHTYTRESAMSAKANVLGAFRAPRIPDRAADGGCLSGRDLLESRGSSSSRVTAPVPSFSASLGEGLRTVLGLIHLPS